MTRFYPQDDETKTGLFLTELEGRRAAWSWGTECMLLYCLVFAHRKKDEAHITLEWDQPGCNTCVSSQHPVTSSERRNQRIDEEAR